MVAVGAVDAHGVRLWLRTERPGRHLLELRRDGAVERLAAFEVRDRPDEDGTISVRYPEDFDAEPLRPWTTYTFAVHREADGGLVGEGRFRTAPANAETTPERFAIAIMSCHQPFTEAGAVDPASTRLLDALDTVLEAHRVERVLLLGDQMYADQPDQLSLFGDHFAAVAPPGRRSILDCTREEVRRLYQQRYRTFWSVPSWKAFQARWPTIAILDDHEIVDNFGALPEHADPRWDALRDGALDAAFDYQGLRSAPREGQRPASMHTAFAHGTVAGFVMDLRSQRRYQGDVLRIVGDDQLAALDRFLDDNGDRHVLVIGLSVPVAHVPDWLVDVATTVGISGDAADRWSNDAASEDRDRLLDRLYQHQERHPGQRIVIVGGDIHVGAVMELKWDRPVPSLWQLVSSAVSNRQKPLEALGADVLPRLGATLELRSGVCCEAHLCDGVGSATQNPFGGLNVGILEFRRVEGGSTVRLLLVSHDDGKPIVVFDSGEL